MPPGADRNLFRGGFGGILIAAVPRVEHLLLPGGEGLEGRFTLEDGEEVCVLVGRDEGVGHVVGGVAKRLRFGKLKLRA